MKSDKNPAWRRPLLRWGTAALVVVAAAYGWSHFRTPPHPPEHGISGGTEIIIPTLAGVVTDINEGYVILSDATSTEPVADTRIPVPAGRWITPTHWQAGDQSIDLFRGQGVNYFLDRKTIVPGLRFAKGVVLSVEGAAVRMRVDEPIPEAGTEPLEPGEYAFRVAPYSHIDRALKPGDVITAGLFGEPGDLILWQVTFWN